jgi:hypothetical protein
VGVDNDFRIGPAVNCQVESSFAGGLLGFSKRLALTVDLDQILRAEKPQRSMLAGNEKAVFPGAAADISSPAGDEPSFEE